MIQVDINVIPEFPAEIILPILMVAQLLPAIIYKRIIKKSLKHAQYKKGKIIAKKSTSSY